MLADRASKVLPKNVREIAVYRTAWTVGCSWCVDFGTMLQRLDGLDTDRLRHIAEYATSDLYSDDEKAAIAYADAMTGDVANDVTDEQVADLERRFGRAGVVELTYQIGLENMRARMNSALGIHDQASARMRAVCRGRMSRRDLLNNLCGRPFTFIPAARWAAARHRVLRGWPCRRRPTHDRRGQ